MERLAKKVSDYCKFVQDTLQQNYNGKYKTPVQIKDKEERDNFFAQVKKLWEEKHSKNK